MVLPLAFRDRGGGLDFLRFASSGLVHLQLLACSCKDKKNSMKNLAAVPPTALISVLVGHRWSSVWLQPSRRCFPLVADSCHRTLIRNQVISLAEMQLTGRDCVRQLADLFSLVPAGRQFS